MNALTTTQNSTPARPTSPVMTLELTSLLDSTGNPDAAVRQIVADPALIGEARAVLPALKAISEAKAGTEGVKAVVGKRFALYPQPPRSEAEAAAWWSEYYDVLAELSLASLEAGMRAYVADPSSEFMPKPGRLRELAFLTPCRSLGRYYRAAMAVKAAEERPALAGPRVEPAEVKAMLGEFQAGIRSERDKPALPSIAGTPPEGSHVTKEMMALIARRAAT